jgi:hypothetical protein
MKINGVQIFIVLIIFSLCSCQRISMKYKGVSEEQKNNISYFIKNIKDLESGGFDTTFTTKYFNTIWKNDRKPEYLLDLIDFIKNKFTCTFNMIKKRNYLVEDVSNKYFEQGIYVYNDKIKYYAQDVFIVDNCSKQEIIFTFIYVEILDKWLLNAIHQYDPEKVEF